jgi:galactose oxidase-like protein
VLFGGDSLRSGRFRDTWEWDGENWTQVADIGPSPRRECAMVYDGVRQNIILFGGVGEERRLGDTWEWDGQDWTQVDDRGPSPGAAHALVFDAVRKRTNSVQWRVRTGNAAGGYLGVGR